MWMRGCPDVLRTDPEAAQGRESPTASHASATLGSQRAGVQAGLSSGAGLMPRVGNHVQVSLRADFA